MWGSIRQYFQFMVPEWSSVFCLIPWCFVSTLGIGLGKKSWKTDGENRIFCNSLPSDLSACLAIWLEIRLKIQRPGFFTLSIWPCSANLASPIWCRNQVVTSPSLPTPWNCYMKGIWKISSNVIQQKWIWCIQVWFPEWNFILQEFSAKGKAEYFFKVMLHIMSF